MAGLARAQQLFTRAIVGTLAALVSLARGDAAGAHEQAKRGIGHPLHAKLLKGKLDGCPARMHLTHRKHCVKYRRD